MPRTYAVLPAARMTRSFSVATIVGALSNPSGSITSGLVRNGSIAEGGMLGISWSESDSARARGASLAAPLAGAPEPAGPVGAPDWGPEGAPDLGPEGVPPLLMEPRARISERTIPGQE